MSGIDNEKRAKIMAIPASNSEHQLSSVCEPDDIEAMEALTGVPLPEMRLPKVVVALRHVLESSRTKLYLHLHPYMTYVYIHFFFIDADTYMNCLQGAMSESPMPFTRNP